MLPGKNFRLLAIAAIIGLLAGALSIFFRAVLEGVHALILVGGQQLLGIGQGGWRALLLPLLPAFGMLLLIPLSLLFPGEINGYNFPRFLRQVNLEAGIIRLRTIFAKIMACALTIGSGGSAGVEGPIAQVCGTIGSRIGQTFRVSGNLMKVFIAAGAAGGVAAMFNAPIAGVFFAAEIVLLRTYALDSFAALVVASAMATVVSRAYYGDSPAFSVPDYTLLNPLLEIPLYSLLGVIIGLLAVLYIAIFYRLRDRFAALKLHPQLKPVLGGLAVGGLAIAFPQVMGDGYHYIEKVLAGEGVLAVMLALILLKMVATGLTLGGGGAGGVFAPALFLGAVSGGAFGTVVHQLLPQHTANPGAYATVGIGAFLAASTHAPLTAIFLLFEMTGNYLIIIPIMLCSIIGTMVAGRLNPNSIDTVDFSREGIDITEGREVALMESIPVGRLVSGDVDFISEEANADQLLQIFSQAKDSFYFPVIDESGRMTGIISLQDVKNVLHDRQLRCCARVGDICTREVSVLTPDDNLYTAMSLFDAKGLDEIPVVEANDNRWVLGMLKRRDVIAAYNKEVIKKGISDQTASIRIT
ncbi:MAG: chloride channel protein [Desulfurivibrio sp.]|nr:chloride channel protein [Desulfurivibrio sp.]